MRDTRELNWHGSLEVDIYFIHGMLYIYHRSIWLRSIRSIYHALFAMVFFCTSSCCDCRSGFDDDVSDFSVDIETRRGGLPRGGGGRDTTRADAIPIYETTHSDSPPSRSASSTTTKRVGQILTKYYQACRNRDQRSWSHDFTVGSFISDITTAIITMGDLPVDVQPVRA